MKNLRLFLILFAVLALCGEGYACTSAIVSATKSSEGVPLLWKHRDASKWNCHIAYVEGGKYAYTALVSLNGKNTYCGINEKGFAVMNNATYNFPIPDKTFKSKNAVRSMGDILSECATVEEFEAWLAKSNGKRSYATIYAVGDPSGAVAYFEVGQEYYKRYDVSERQEGFDVRGNFCFSGIEEKRGLSINRYNIAMNQMKERAMFTPHDFIDFSRNYMTMDGSCILDEPNSVVKAQTSIIRYSSAASSVMVCDAENPRMLVAVGHPAAAMAVPVYVKAKNAIPECVSGRAMLDLCNDFRTKTYKNSSKTQVEMNKPLIGKVVKIETTCKMPSEYPKNITKFNNKIDKLFAKHAKKVRKVLK